MKPVEKMNLKELLEAQLRHKKILSNRSLLLKLPDRGEKFLETQNKIEECLLKYEKEEKDLSQLFTGMKLSCPRVDVNQMEWTGKAAQCESSSSSAPTISQENDEDERDIVNILLTTNQLSKIVIDEREKKSPLKGSNNKTNTPDLFYQHLAEKVEHLNPVDHKFKPFRTLNHEKVPSPKESHIKWENTAATPPTFKYSDGVKSINLEESMELQLETETKIKNLEFKKLFNNTTVSPDTVINPAEFEEVYDDEHEGVGSGIVVTVNVSTEDEEVD